MLRKGFTLIELLIVVAIIAILAAIAVPNFLEAQIRSKIARVKADMRSLQLACESYRIDSNGYPLDNIRKPAPSGPVQPDMSSWCLLTTPVAYMSSIPQTPFREYKTENCVPVYTGTDKNPGNYLEYWAGNWSSGVYTTPATCRDTGIWWRASSVGPDNISDFHNQFGTQPGASIDPRDIKNRNPNLVKCIYDSTNGTTSKGDLFITSAGFFM